jgi:sulfonate transport system permease protein
MNKKPLNLWLRILLSISAPVAILLVWQIAGLKGCINQAILPTLEKVITVAKDLILNGTLWENIAVSLGRVMKGFVIGSVLGIVVGIIMGLSQVVYTILQTLVGIFRPIPMIAWIPLFILWIGIGDGFKITLIALGTFWSVLLNTIHGIQSVDPKLLEVASALEKNRFIMIRKIILPAALPAILTGLRLGMGVAWSSVVASEMIAASKGIGYMIMFAREMAQPAKLMVGVFTIGLVGLLIDTIILKLQKWLIKW